MLRSQDVLMATDLSADTSGTDLAGYFDRTGY
jgi:hypothetical protein